MPIAPDNVQVRAIYVSRPAHGTGVDGANNWLGTSYEDSNIQAWSDSYVNRIYLSGLRYLCNPVGSGNYTSANKAKLRAFIQKCTNAGIEVYAVASITSGSSSTYTNSGLLKVVDYNSGSAAGERILGVQTEDEYWNGGSFSGFLNACTQANTYLSANNLLLDSYLANPSPGELPQLIGIIDTFWLTSYQYLPKYSRIRTYVQELGAAATGLTTTVKVGVLVSAESYTTNQADIPGSSTYSFMGEYFEGKNHTGALFLNPPVRTSSKSIYHTAKVYTHYPLPGSAPACFNREPASVTDYIDWQGIEVFSWRQLYSMTNLVGYTPNEVWATGNGAVSAANIANQSISANVAALVPFSASRFLYLGDVYENGTQSDFIDPARSYDLQYGTQSAHNLNHLTSATVGHKDSSNVVNGYDKYWSGQFEGVGSVYGQWDGSSTDVNPRNYSFYVGGWKFICINSMEDGYPGGGVSNGSSLYNWLSTELSGGDKRKIVFCHHPRFSMDTVYGDNANMQPVWDLMQGNALILLSAHVHNYQRFKMRDATGKVVPGCGVYQINVATGGDDLYGWNLGYTDGFGDPAFESRYFGYGAVRLSLFDDYVNVKFYDYNGVVRDDADIQVESNTPPVVDAGPDQVLTGSTATLSGSVSDPCSPAGSVLTYSWSKISGPGTVLFTDIYDLNDTVLFSSAGVYVLRLTADDGFDTSYDEVQITVPSISSTIKTLTIESSNPDTGVTVTSDIPDDGGAISSVVTDVITPPSFQFFDTRQPVLTADATSGGNVFDHWLRDGSIYSYSRSFQVTDVLSHTYTAVYVAPSSSTTVRKVRIISNQPGATFTVNVADLFGVTTGSADSYNMLYYLDGTSISITFSGTANGGVTYTGYEIQKDAVIQSTGAGNPVALTVTGGEFMVQAQYNTLAGTFSVSILGDAICNGATHQVYAYPGGGTAPYTYSWQPSGGGTPISTVYNPVLSPGTYRLVVNDSAAKSVTYDDIELLEIPVIVANETITNPSCNTGIGSIELAPTGGPGDGQFTYAWTTGETTSSISNVPGTYGVTITDSIGCSKAFSFDIETSFPLTVLESHIEPSCNGSHDGEITLSVSGGVMPVTSYSWFKDNILIPGETTATLSGIGAGDYSYTVIDTDGCVESGSVTLSEPSAIVVTITKVNISSIGAADGEIHFSATGGSGSGYQYSISDTFSGSPDFVGVEPGDYYCQVMDGDGCLSPVQLVRLTDPNYILIALYEDLIVNAPCNGANGTYAVSVWGTGRLPYTVVWKQGPTVVQTTTVTGFANRVVTYTGPSGVYTVEATGSDGSFATIDVTIGVQETGTLSVIDTTNVSVEGGSNGSAVVLYSNTDQSSYPVTMSVTYPDGQTFQVAVISSDSQKLITDLYAGLYTVDTVDYYGCVKSTAISITEPGPAVPPPTGDPFDDQEDDQLDITNSIKKAECCLGDEIYKVFQLYKNGHNQLDCFWKPALIKSSMLKTIKNWYPVDYSFGGSDGYFAFKIQDDTLTVPGSHIDITMYDGTVVSYDGDDNVNNGANYQNLVDVLVNAGYSAEIDSGVIWIYFGKNSFMNGLPVSISGTFPFGMGSARIRITAYTYDGIVGACDVCYAENLLPSQCLTELEAENILSQLRCNCCK